MTDLSAMVVAKMLYGPNVDLALVIEDVSKLDRRKAEHRAAQAAAVLGGAQAVKETSHSVSQVRRARRLGLKTTLPLPKEGEEALHSVAGLGRGARALARVKSPAAALAFSATALTGDVAINHTLAAKEKKKKPKSVVTAKNAPESSELMPLGTLGVLDERAKKRRKKDREEVLKAFREMVDTAVEIGFVSPEGEIAKFDTRELRDKSGKFTRGSINMGKDVMAAGILGGASAYLGLKGRPKAMAAIHDMKFVTRLMRSSDPKDRAIAQAFLPGIARTGATAVSLVGLAAGAGVASGHDANQAAQRFNRIRTKTYQAVSEDKEEASKRDTKRKGSELTQDEVEAGGLLAAATGTTAAGAKFAHTVLHKSDEQYDVVWEGEFSKVDTDKRQVFGWASITKMNGKPVVDLQGDYIDPDEMERAAYEYVMTSGIGGDMHRRVGADAGVSKTQPLHVSDLIESFVVTPEKIEKMGLPEETPIGWWVGFKVHDDDTWSEVRKGNRRGFSIHGMGSRVERALEEIDPNYTMLTKAYEVSETSEELVANLETLYEVTGEEIFKVLIDRVEDDDE